METASQEVAILLSLCNIARNVQRQALALSPTLAAEVQSYIPPRNLQPPLRLLTAPNVVDDIHGLPISHEYTLLLRPFLLRVQESWAEALRSAWERILVARIFTPIQAMELVSRACLDLYEHTLLPRMKRAILSAAQRRASIPDMPFPSHQKFKKVSLPCVLGHSLILLFRTVFPC
jgi:hypothetical protein